MSFSNKKDPFCIITFIFSIKFFNLIVTLCSLFWQKVIKSNYFWMLKYQNGKVVRWRPFGKNRRFFWSYLPPPKKRKVPVFSGLCSETEKQICTPTIAKGETTSFIRVKLLLSSILISEPFFGSTVRESREKKAQTNMKPKIIGGMRMLSVHLKLPDHKHGGKFARKTRKPHDRWCYQD